MVQWVRLDSSTAGGVGLIPGRGAKIPQATWLGQKKQKKRFLLEGKGNILELDNGDGCIRL